MTAPTARQEAERVLHAAELVIGSTHVADRPAVYAQLGTAWGMLAVIDAQATSNPIRCDYCGDALPSVKRRADVPTTPDLQRLGFAADKIVCPECVASHANGR